MKPRHLLGVAALLALAACGGGAAGMTGVIEGTVLLGPRCPVAQAGQPCPDAPAPGAKVLVRDRGRVVAATGAGADGRFELAAPVGRHLTVTAEVDGALSCAPEEVEVRADETVTVTVTCDTGIR